MAARVASANEGNSKRLASDRGDAFIIRLDYRRGLTPDDILALILGSFLFVRRLFFLFFFFLQYSSTLASMFHPFESSRARISISVASSIYRLCY